MFIVILFYFVLLLLSIVTESSLLVLILLPLGAGYVLLETVGVLDTIPTGNGKGGGIND